MTIVHWPPGTVDVQYIENGCFTGLSPVWPTICQAYSSEVVFALGLSAAYSQKTQRWAGRIHLERHHQ
jgi:hypothetical protein